MCVCVCVRYLVESYMHLIHQVGIKVTNESLQLFRVGYWLCLLHLVTYSSHHCMLHTRNTHGNRRIRVAGKEHWWTTDSFSSLWVQLLSIHDCSCSDLHLFLEGKVSPRNIEWSNQLNLYLFLAAVFQQLTSCSKQFHILVWNVGHHIAYLSVEVQHCLQEDMPVKIVQKARKSTLMSGRICVCVYWYFTLSALLGPVGRGGLGGISALTLQERETHLSTLYSQPFVFHRAMTICNKPECICVWIWHHWK